MLPDLEERATRYLVNKPGAVSGNGGHPTTFRAACILIQGFGLNVEQARPILNQWNATCDPPWSEKELEHKLADAAKEAGFKEHDGTMRPRGSLAAQPGSFRFSPTKMRATNMQAAHPAPRPDRPDVTEDPPAPQYPDIVDMTDVLASPPPRPAELIQDLAFCGSKIFLQAPSKARKTFIQLDLGLSVALGQPWLGHMTRQSPVLFVNLELNEYSFWSRVNEILKAKGAQLPFGQFHVWHLRGHQVTIEQLALEIQPYVRDGGYALIDFDPVYKLWGGRNENAANEVGNLLGHIEGIGHAAEAATLCCHHFAKGSAAGKETIDRGSGSGVIGRDSDLILTLTPHREDECFTLEYIARDFAPVASVVVRWEYPVFKIDTSLNPESLKTQFGTGSLITDDDILAAVTARPQTREEIQTAVCQATGRGLCAAKQAFRKVADSGALQFTVEKRSGTRSLWRYYK